MKRNTRIIALLALALFVAACATTSAAPNVKGVVTKVEGSTITVQPASGEAATVTVPFGTTVLWGSGLKAGRSDVVVGTPVHVYLSDGTQTAKKIVIAD